AMQRRTQPMRECIMKSVFSPRWPSSGFRTRSFLPVLFIICTAGSFCLTLADEPPKKPEPHSPLSPQQAQRAFHIAPGLRIELVVAEPDIQSPVAMLFDEDGRLWVVEMGDYPNGPPPGQPPEGRIKVLEDRDGTGRYRLSRVFADRLLFANGLLRWKDGVL